MNITRAWFIGALALILGSPACKSTGATPSSDGGNVRDSSRTPPTVGGGEPQGIGRGTVKPTAPDGAFGKKAFTKRRVFTHAIENAADFKAYSRKVGTERFTKFIVDVRSDRIYYFDVNVYKLHVDFVFSELYKVPQTNARIIDFNRNYESNKPEFLLCYLVHHTDQDVWTFAFWEGDLASDAHVARAYQRMKRSFFGGDKVKFRPDSTLQEELLGKPAMKGIPTISNDKLYKAAPYHAFTTGSSVGKLRIAKSSKPSDINFAPDEIALLVEVLPDITPVRGIISEQFSTPLAHVALRARAWGIPHVGMKAAAKKYAQLDGEWVFFEAKAGGATLRRATTSEIAADKKRRSAARAVKLPKADLQQKKLKWLPDIRATEAGAYGAKSANLGEIAYAALPGFEVPKGFAIPVAYYQQHMAKHRLDKAVSKLLTNPRFNKDSNYRKAELTRLREMIAAKPLDPALDKAIAQHLARMPLGGSKGVFVRSSTNAEDLPGFNGAGLYDTVPNVTGAKDAAAAVKRVWASVWNRRAFEERTHFGIDHNSVYGAVLIQQGVNATAAGVLITANIFDRHDKTSYTINAKSGLGIRVVEGKKVPEQLIFDMSNFGIKVLSRSDEDTMLVFDSSGGVKEVPNPNKGKPVLTDERAMRLAMAAKALTRLFPPDRPIDVEWLFEHDTLHIVQSRPYIGL